MTAVPKIIHRIWLDEPMPEPMVEFGRKWQNLNPGWQLVDWTWSGQLPQMLNQKLVAFAADHCPNDTVRFVADVVRLELLARFGGVYADCDIDPARPLDDMLDELMPRDARVLVGRSPQHRGGVHPITNAFMASTPSAPWVIECLWRLGESVEEYAGQTLAVMAGPWHCTRVYDAGHFPDVCVVDDLYEQGWFEHLWNSAARRAGAGIR